MPEIITETSFLLLPQKEHVISAIAKGTLRVEENKLIQLIYLKGTKRATPHSRKKVLVQQGSYKKEKPAEASFSRTQRL
jgi:hypothetical protein